MQNAPVVRGCPAGDLRTAATSSNGAVFRTGEHVVQPRDLDSLGDSWEAAPSVKKAAVGVSLSPASMGSCFRAMSRTSSQWLRRPAAGTTPRDARLAICETIPAGVGSTCFGSATRTLARVLAPRAPLSPTAWTARFLLVRASGRVNEDLARIWSVSVSSRLAKWSRSLVRE